MSRLSPGLVPLFLAAVALPVLTLMGFGIYALFSYGYMLHFTGLLALCALAGALSVRLIRKSFSHAAMSPPDESMVQPSPDWSGFDIEVWNSADQHIRSILEKESEWSVMGMHARSTAMYVAERYHGGSSRKELAFSAIELLKMMEEVSRRYRKTLKQHVPYVEKVNISTLKLFYDHKDKVSAAGKIWNVYRAYRVFTPYGLLAEARGMIIGKLFSGVSKELQFRLKTAFLQEVASVAIDLYSGRFKFDEQSLSGSQKDVDLMAPEPEPIRVCMVGQVSAGKSAVVNALLGSVQAEAGKLPATDRAGVYKCRLQGLDIIHLVDLPGLNSEEKNEQLLIDEVCRSDLVLWVVKANQQSRGPDVAFFEKIQAFYADSKNRSRKQPVFVGLLNQVDRLKPVNDWQPPYNLDSPDVPKAATIRDALDYNRKLLKFDDWIPLCVGNDRVHYNVQELVSAIQSRFDAALQVQFNRRRLTHGNAADISENFKRFRNAASVLFNNPAESRE